MPTPTNLAERTFETVGGTGGEDAVKKFMRLYLPRTYDQLVASCKLVILSDFEARLVPSRQFIWMRLLCTELLAPRLQDGPPSLPEGHRRRETSPRGLAMEEGMGLAKYEINWDARGHIRAWEFLDMRIANPLFDAFPTDFVVGRQVMPSDGIIPTKGNPVTDLPGIERYSLLTSGTYGAEIPRKPRSFQYYATTHKGTQRWEARCPERGCRFRCCPDSTRSTEWR